ncbi:MAG TPA: hypothetical protein PKE04_07595, partial [Clostridia bacterium]|nr:hypothetical protein [Clostridia bacterium]
MKRTLFLQDRLIGLDTVPGARYDTPIDFVDSENPIPSSHPVTNANNSEGGNLMYLEQLFGL